MRIIYSPQFIREYQRLSKIVKEKAEGKDKIFQANPFDARLKTHKLEGRLSELWSFSIDYRYRIIFELRDEKTAIFHAIGDHSLYSKL